MSNWEGFEGRRSKRLNEYHEVQLSLTFKPRFSISARSEADQEVEDVRKKAKIVRKA